jgi:DNA-binding MarR family transcriptional regulator
MKTNTAKSDVKVNPGKGGPSTVEEDLGELVALLADTVRGLKSSADPPPEALLAAVRAGSLGRRHMPALLAVTLAGPISVSELAKRLGLELSTTSTIVGQLSRAGLLDRAEDENDRRRTIVRLHDDHRESLSAWSEEAVSPIRATLARLSPEARAHFMDGWRLLHEEATRRGAGAPECSHP